jgi:tRNA(Ile)-lysidine synthase
MIKKFEKHITSIFPFIKEKKILLGISGGVDSMVLAYLFKNLGYNLTLAHVNFQLRGSYSDEDENFVTHWAQDNKLPLFRTTFDTNTLAKERKISVEMVARDLRYEWFNELMGIHGFDYLAVAHHLNDNIETVLMNLSRGTGITGLTGMKDVNGKIIRPLLIFPRKEIEIFATEVGIDWREDLTNADTVYKRNKVRHELIPVFEEMNPSFVESFLKTVKYLRQTELIQNEYLKNVDYSFWKQKDETSMSSKRNSQSNDYSLMQNSSDKNRKLYTGEIIEINIEKLTKIVAFETVLREKLKPFGFNNIDDIVASFNLESGREYFSKTHRIVKDRGRLLIEEIREQKEDVFYIDRKTTELIYPLHLKFTKLDSLEKNTNPFIAQIDIAKLNFPLKLRKWKEGDFFYPQGMKGKKKISKFFKDEKYSLIDKENQWLLLSEDKIVWVLGKRLDERFKVTDFTTDVLKIVNN